MLISDFAIRRPVVTVVSMVALSLFGIIGLSQLKTDEFPDVAPPFVSVGVPYPGSSPDVVERVWRTAADLGYGQYFNPGSWGPITDDHLPLLEKGIPIIDVIDIAYSAHHTPDDTIDKVSAESLKIVGDVAWAVLQR